MVAFPILTGPLTDNITGKLCSRGPLNIDTLSSVNSDNFPLDLIGSLSLSGLIGPLEIKTSRVGTLVNRGPLFYNSLEFSIINQGTLSHSFTVFGNYTISQNLIAIQTLTVTKIPALSIQNSGTLTQTISINRVTNLTISHTINAYCTIHNNPRTYTILSLADLQQNLQENMIRELSILSEAILNQTFAKVIDLDLLTEGTIVQALDYGRGVTSSPTLIQILTFELVKPIRHTLTAVSTFSVVTIRSYTITSTGHLVSTLTNKTPPTGDCSALETWSNYSTVLGSSPIFSEHPNIVLSWPAVSPTLTLTLPWAKLDNTEDVTGTRQLVTSRGGSLNVIQRSDLEVSQLSLTFDALTVDEIISLRDFLDTSLGEDISVVDWLNRTWVGIITNPDLDVISAQACNEQFALQFEGELT